MAADVRPRRVRINDCAADSRTFNLNNCLQDVTFAFLSLRGSMLDTFVHHQLDI